MILQLLAIVIFVNFAIGQDKAPIVATVAGVNYSKDELKLGASGSIDEKLSSLIWTMIEKDICPDSRCTPSADEIAAFKRATDTSVASNMQRAKIHTEKLLAEAETRLRNRQVSSPDAEKTKIEIARLKERLKLLATDSVRAEVVGAEDDVPKMFIRRWKINQILYKAYGGTVIFQQAGPEPVGAYRAVLEKYNREGKFKIIDKSLSEKFWQYYVRKHPFETPKASVDFDTPWWLTPKK